MPNNKNKKITAGSFRYKQQYQAIFDSFDTLIVYKDINGRLVNVNQSFADFHGLSKNNLIGKSTFDIVKPRIAAKNVFDDDLQVIRTGKPKKAIETKLTSVFSKKEIFGIYSKFPYYDEKGKIIGTITFFVDITEKQKADEEAKKLASIVENTSEAIALIDLGVKNLIRYVNPAWTKLFGYTDKEIVNKKEGLIIKAAKRQKKLYTKLMSFVKAGKEFSAEMEWQAKSGRLIPVEVFSVPMKDKTGKIIIWINTIRDITEKKKTTKALNQKKEDLEKLLIELNREKVEYEAMISSIGEGLIATNKKGKIIHINKVAADLLGLNIKKVLNESFFDIWQVVDEQDKIVSLKKRSIAFPLLTREKFTTTDYYYLRPDKTKFPIAITITPIILNKETIGAISIFRDITVEKQIDKAKTEFVAVASHQLNTPLTGIKWFASLLLKRDLDATTKDYVKQIDISNERMIGLIGDLLDVSHIETSKKFGVTMKKVDLVSIIKNIIKEQWPEANKKNINLLLAINWPQKLILIADALKIRQVFQNLINNAIKYSKENTKININFRQTDKTVVVAIKDHGIGIPQSQQNRVFNKFFRANNALTVYTTGTGLGLYIAQAIIKAHQGKIWFESKENKGTTFYVSLPI